MVEARRQRQNAVPVTKVASPRTFAKGAERYLKNATPSKQRVVMKQHHFKESTRKTLSQIAEVAKGATKSKDGRKAIITSSQKYEKIKQNWHFSFTRHKSQNSDVQT